MVNFNSKQWKDRIPEFPGRRQLKRVEGEVDIYDVIRADGEAITKGDWFNASTMNDLEGRINKLGLDAANVFTTQAEDIGILNENLDTHTIPHGELLKTRMPMTRRGFCRRLMACVIYGQ